MNKERVVEVVTELVNRKFEGDYWDYKQEWHKHNEKLIHDILCLANTTHDRDCYLIIGVSDSGEIVGLENRKKQADIINLISNFPFAGGNYPKIELYNILLENKNVDVLMVKNSGFTPFYLEPRNKNYQFIRPGFIYSRNGDSNTAIDKNSDPILIEELWRKRLGINKPAIERFGELLDNKDNWKYVFNLYHHIYEPSFTIETLDEDNDNEMFYSYVMTNERTRFETLVVRYNNVPINSCQIVNLDSGRYTTVTPDWYFFKFHNNGVREVFEYKYFIKETLEYKLHKFLLDDNEEALYAYRRFMKVIVVFESHKELNDFNNYLLDKENEFRQRLNVKLEKKSRLHAQDKRRIEIGKLVNEMLNEFRIK